MLGKRLATRKGSGPPLFWRHNQLMLLGTAKHTFYWCFLIPFLIKVFIEGNLITFHTPLGCLLKCILGDAPDPSYSLVYKRTFFSSAVDVARSYFPFGSAYP
jgi:hypothetical protein